jgi:hypothetical protein
MAERLPWRRDPRGGFIAYPDGDEHPDRCARVYYAPTSTGGVNVWHWWTSYGKAHQSGVASSKQSAAEVATTVWPQMAEEAEKTDAAEQEARELVDIIAAAVDDGDATRLDVANASYQRLINANWHLRKHLERRLHAGEPTGNVEAVMAAISSELYARRRRRKTP